jgi:DNA repair protein RAD16
MILPPQGMGKTIQTIALILKHRDDPIVAPIDGPPIYESKGVLKLRADAEKAQKKAEREANRALAKAAKEAAKRRKARAARRKKGLEVESDSDTEEEPTVPSSSSVSSSSAAAGAAGNLAPVQASDGGTSSPIVPGGAAAAAKPRLRIALHGPLTKSSSVQSASSASASAAVPGKPLLDPIMQASVSRRLQAGERGIATPFGLDPSAPSEFTFQSRAATLKELTSQVRQAKDEEAARRDGDARSRAAAIAAQAAAVAAKKPSQPRLAVRAPGGVASHCTLVVCPVVAIPHWRREIERHVTPGKLKVHVHHGSKRTTDPAELLRADVVLTSYSVVEAEFRKMIAPSKLSCKYCGRSFMPDKMRTHLKYFCGPDAMLTEAQAKQERGETKQLKGWMQRMLAKKKQPKTTPPSKAASSKKVPKLAVAAASVSSASLADALGGSAAPGGSKPNPSRRLSSKTTAQAPDDDDDDDSVTWTGLGQDKPARAAAAKPARATATKPARATATKPSASRSGSKATAANESDDDGDDYNSANATSSSDEEEEDDDEAMFATDEELSDAQPKRSRLTASTSASSVREAQPDDDDDDTEDEGEVDEVEEEEEEGVPSLGPVSPLQRIYWRRVVLDEAHAIKNLASATARAILALTAQRRWCLSGTPLQNRAGELNALVRFLRVDPFAYYFCTGCECKNMEYMFRGGVGKCPECGHSPMRHYSWLGRYVTNPIRYHPGTPRAVEGMQRLRGQILPSVLLRRTKQGRSGDMALPCRLVRLRRDRLDRYEEDFYSALYTQSQAQFGAYVTKGTVLNNYAHIFGLLMRLRQAVDHPFLVLYSQSAASAAAAAGARDTATAGACVLCHEPAESPVTAQCGHSFCRTCVTDYTNSFAGTSASASSSASSASASVAEEGGSDGEGSAVIQCPSCLAPLCVDLSRAASAAAATSSPGPGIGAPGTKRNGILARVPSSQLGRLFRSSTKIEALLEELARAQAEEPGCKSIVFSQFTSMLDLIEHRLSHAGVRCVKLDGRMSVTARDRIISAFDEDPSILVFLISLKAGGVALNLTAASRTFLMDPWWNPAAEEQALDRTHRIGQHRPITAVRFVIADSIEERILKLQEKKKLVFEGTIGQDTQALARLTEADMRFLFSG